ncbi:hypothetical protein [Novosphingobium sp. P6W]|uniref:hypothetical protein n=1 Tax=Novosphingobium sp. P6W TaxID=1609758 RepID=UPI0005C2B8F1|nr:hypothetical protein [Novosphingobium sp. P6W]AXB76826.1 hypothetical protein TQ38_010270 [Novosphingobium sp. P6W]KIS33324.1 hypothetical protein TQ38_07855 [Novosphingobium sp. P6W]
MTRLITAAVLIAVLAAALWYGTHWYAEQRLRTAFAEAGMTDEAAACMGRRLVQRLSLGQLRKLAALQEEHRSLHGVVKAVERMDDPRITKVTASSALLCTTGFAR